MTPLTLCWGLFGVWSKFIYLARRHRPANAPSSVDVSGETKTTREEEDELRMVVVAIFTNMSELETCLNVHHATPLMDHGVDACMSLT